MRPSAGFTLLEVVVVVSLLAIVAAVTAPALRNLGPTDPGDIATIEVVRLLRTARATAIDQAAAVTLRLDPIGKAWVLDSDSAGAFRRVAEGRLELPPQTALSTEVRPLAFRFQPNGLAQADSFFVQTPHGARRVAVNPWNGEPDAR